MYFVCKARCDSQLLSFDCHVTVQHVTTSFFLFTSFSNLYVRHCDIHLCASWILMSVRAGYCKTVQVCPSVAKHGLRPVKLKLYLFDLLWICCATCCTTIHNKWNEWGLSFSARILSKLVIHDRLHAVVDVSQLFYEPIL